jgi:bifunctional DNA-binding transcriptional regulator/antitoxin component of YhaV-PrlF toxin-antitoxin module
MKITSEGQVTIPQDIREKAGLLLETEVEFIFDGTTVTLVKKSDLTRPSRGQQTPSTQRD